MTPIERAIIELEALKVDLKNCTPPSQRGYVFAAVFPLIQQRILDLNRWATTVPSVEGEASGSAQSAAQESSSDSISPSKGKP